MFLNVTLGVVLLSALLLIIPCEYRFSGGDCSMGNDSSYGTAFGGVACPLLEKTVGRSLATMEVASVGPQLQPRATMDVALSGHSLQVLRDVLCFALKVGCAA